MIVLLLICQIVILKKIIEAFVTRLIRYKENKIKIKNFFRIRHFLKNNKIQNLVLDIEGKQINIIKNGYSIQSVLAQLISQSYFMEKYIFFRSAIPFLNGELCRATETDFLNKFEGKIN